MEVGENRDAKAMKRIFLDGSGEPCSEKNEACIIEQLSQNPDLHVVELIRVYITDKIADALLQLPHLSRVVMRCSYYESLAFLKEAKRLAQLRLSEFCSAEGIGELTQLKSLESCNCRTGLVDLTALKPLQNLESLSFYSTSFGGDFTVGSNVRDVSPLKHLANLRSLSVDFSGSDLACFSELTQLRSLYLGISSSSILEPLGSLTNLQMLGISVDSKWGIFNVMSLEPLAGLTNLAYLGISRNKVRSLEPLRNLIKLQFLYCGDNEIRTLKPLEKLTELRELNASDNSIRSVKPLANLIKLTGLALGENPIRDFSPIQSLPNYTPEWETDDRLGYGSPSPLAEILPS